MWCMGNEVGNEWKEDGCKVGKWLEDMCDGEDGSGGVSEGMDGGDEVVGNNFGGVMDIGGLN